MKSSKSIPNMDKLDNSVDRSTLSTPIARPPVLGSGLVQSRSSMMTPPQLLPSHIVSSSSSEHAEIAATASVVHPKKDDDDVFGADDPPRSNHISSLGPVTPQTRIEQDPQPFPSDYEPLPRLDKLNEELSPDNAQSVLPPKALVFVANLPTDQSETALAKSCTEIFEAFGQCYVTVKRDSRNHPFAFVQYCTEEDALAAIEGGKDLTISGRKIRTEKGNARRSVILTRVGGGLIARDEAYEVLCPYGPIENLTPISNQEKLRLGTGEGMRVEFEYVGDYMVALKQFHLDRSNLAYRLMNAPDIDQHLPIRPPLQAPRSATDQKSIFVGNLPDDTEEKDIHEKFEKFGTIMTCNIIRKPITGGSGFNVFGFIEFQTIAQAGAAARQTDVDIRGHRIRVEPKEYSARRSARLGFGRTSAQSHYPPRGRGWGQHNAQQQYPQGVSQGFFGLFTQTPFGSFVPVNLPMYGYTATPPSSTYRQGVQAAYVHHSSPHRTPQAHQAHQAHPLIPHARGGNNNNMRATPQANPQANPQAAAGMQTPHPLQQKRWR